MIGSFQRIGKSCIFSGKITILRTLRRNDKGRKIMFGLGKKNREVIGAPIQGNVVELSQVKDPTFGQEILGKGVAIIPSVGRVVAPCDGHIEMVFDTKHAISMKSESGIEILIHVGIDTVTLKGEHFKSHVETGQEVKKGTLLLEFDIGGIKKAGLEVISPIVICNTPNYKKIIAHAGKKVSELDEVLTLMK